METKNRAMGAMGNIIKYYYDIGLFKFKVFVQKW